MAKEIDNDSEQDVTLPLGSSSLEDIVTALLGGQAILRREDAVPFILTNEDSRKIFSYYAEHRELWPRSKQIQVREIDCLLESLDENTPEKSASQQSDTVGPKLWKLRRLEAHRFGGLHRHCGLRGEDPEPFVLEVDRDLTLISGFNGAGKTALQSAIIWCLTNKALRSQHMPDEIHAPMAIRWSENIGDEHQAEREISLPPIVPIPSGDDLDNLNDVPIADTWVQLTFQSEASGEMCQVRRELVSNARGRINVSVSGLDKLGLSTLAIEAGTLMPGIASNMRFDEKTTFAGAIAQLTGLKPLADLGQRTQRVIKRLETDEVKKTETAKKDKLTQFKSTKQTIVDTWVMKPDLGDPIMLVDPDNESEDRDSETSIVEARQHLERIQGEFEAATEKILGRCLELGSPNDIERMLNTLSNAADQLKPTALKGLSSIATVMNLGNISDSDRSAAKRLIKDFVSRAVATSKRMDNEKQAARWQLYVRVAAWHKEHHPDTELANCPVCGTDLDNVPADALLDTHVKEALQQSREADVDAAKSAQEWKQDATREFLDGLPESLRTFADKVLPTNLLEVYKHAYVKEVLAQSAFNDVLQPIKKNAEAVWEIAAKENPLPDAAEAVTCSLPKGFESGTLAKRLANVVHAIFLSEHRQISKENIKNLADRYFGTAGNHDNNEIGREADEVAADLAPLRTQVEMVRKSLESAAPVVSLIRQLDELDKARKEWDTENNRLVLLDRAATAMRPFLEFTALVEEQVSGLLQALDDGTKTWLEKLYRPHYRGGPSYSGFDPTEERGVGLRAGIGDMQVPAHQIMNASMLRACVWAFLFSLWEHVRKKVGGLDCLLLDDPQTHFDPINAENLAAAIPNMPDYEMRPIVTSNDNRFLSAIRDKLPRRTTDKPTWTALQLNPISSSRLTASVSPSVEEVHERRTEWIEDENNAKKAQEFVERVRLYIENRLWNLLASDPMVMHKPTLADLLNALRGARNNGEHPFDEPPFEKLLNYKALKDNDSFYSIINKAHHQLNDITPHEAGEVSDEFKKVDQLMRSCSASYNRFMGRLTREDQDLLLVDLPAAPTPVSLGNTTIQMLGEISARSSADSLAISDGVETINLSEFGDVALFGVRSASLGTFALQGQIVIASLSKEARDGDPVVVISDNKIFARRYCADRRDPSRIALMSDLSGTEKVPPALVLPRARSRILPIIGVLYDKNSFSGSNEARVVEGCKILQNNLLAARVVDDSAYPVIQNGDTVLLETIENPRADEINKLQGEIVAFVASRHGESYGYLKRVGNLIQPGIRIYENVGMNGNAIVVSLKFEEEEVAGDIYSLERLWLVRGVLKTAR